MSVNWKVFEEVCLGRTRGPKREIERERKWEGRHKLQCVLMC